MRLPFQRSEDPAAERSPRPPPAADGALVEAARMRARRRLTGALVLLVLGVVGFPLIFETQPRPLPVDTPIEIRAREGAGSPAPPPAAVPAAVTQPAAPAPPAATVAQAPAEPAPPAALPPQVAESATAAPAVETPPPPPRPAAAAVPAEAPAARSDDGARARALLEGAAARDGPAPAAGIASAAAPSGSRFVVQVGAYSDAATLREARQRVERLGLKTYTQVIETDAGRRTRVRVGPYPSRDEADAAAARVKAAGLPAHILAL